jgi:hypothetical protein
MRTSLFGNGGGKASGLRFGKRNDHRQRSPYPKLVPRSFRLAFAFVPASRSQAAKFRCASARPTSACERRGFHRYWLIRGVVQGQLNSCEGVHVTAQLEPVHARAVKMETLLNQAALQVQQYLKHSYPHAHGSLQGVTEQSTKKVSVRVAPQRLQQASGYYRVADSKQNPCVLAKSSVEALSSPQTILRQIPGAIAGFVLLGFAVPFAMISFTLRLTQRRPRKVQKPEHSMPSVANARLESSSGIAASDRLSGSAWATPRGASSNVKTDADGAQVSPKTVTETGQHASVAASKASWWCALQRFFMRREAACPGTEGIDASRNGAAPGSEAMSGTPLFEALYADCHGSVLAIRCASLSRAESAPGETERRPEFPAFLNHLQGFSHGRLGELCEQCNHRNKRQIPQIIGEVARKHIEKFLFNIHAFMKERDYGRALRETDALLRWYRNWLCPCIDECAAGNEQVTNVMRKVVIPQKRREQQESLSDAYRCYVSRMYKSTIFAHMIAYEAKNLAALRSLFGLGWSQIKELEEAVAAEVWRCSIDEALSIESETEERTRRASHVQQLPLHEPHTRKRLREMRRFLVAVLGEERASSSLSRAVKPIVEEEAIRVLISRRFPDDTEIQRLIVLAACLDCDVLDAIRRASEVLGIEHSTRVRVLLHVTSQRLKNDFSSLSFRS